MKRMVFAGFVAAMMLAAGPSQARDYVYGSWVSPKHNVNAMVLPKYFEQVTKDTNGAIKWKIVAGGQLVDGKGTLPGLRDSLVDAGLQIPIYATSDLPATAMIFQTLQFNGDPVAATGSSNEFTMLHCPQCLEEFKKTKTVYLGGYAVTPYHVMCRKEVHDVADLKGLKIRATGAFVTMLKLTDATPVAMDTATAVEAVQRGTIDCSLNSMSWLKTYGYQDVTKRVLNQPLGSNQPAIFLFFSRTTWSGFTADQRKAHFKHAPGATASAAIDAYLKADADILKEAQAKHGVVLDAPGKGWDDVIKRYIALQIEENVKFATARKVRDPKALLAKYDEAQAKWNRLSKEIGGDVTKFTAALKREIYDKIDPNKL